MLRQKQCGFLILSRCFKSFKNLFKYAFEIFKKYFNFFFVKLFFKIIKCTFNLSQKNCLKGPSLHDSKFSAENISKDVGAFILLTCFRIFFIRISMYVRQRDRSYSKGAFDVFMHRGMWILIIPLNRTVALWILKIPLGLIEKRFNFESEISLSKACQFIWNQFIFLSDKKRKIAISDR